MCLAPKDIEARATVIGKVREVAGGRVAGEKYLSDVLEDADCIAVGYEALYDSGIIYDARTAQSESQAGACRDRVDACPRIKYNSVNLGVCRERDVSYVRETKRCRVRRGIGHGHRCPVACGIPIAGAGIKIPRRAAGKSCGRSG